MLQTSGKPGAAQVHHLSELSAAQRIRRYGDGSVELPARLTAGAYSTVTFHYTVGETPLTVGARIRIAWRWPLDWADLQSTDPQGDGYMCADISTSAAVHATQPTIELRFQQLGDLDPWMHCIDLCVTHGQLQPGDQVRLQCGDCNGGGAGWRAPTCRVNAAQFLMLIDPTASDQWLRLADLPSFAIQPGPPHRIIAVTPADGVIGEPFDLIIRAEDRWGNATPLAGVPQLSLRSSAQDATAGEPTAALAGAECDVTQGPTFPNPAAHHYSLRLARPGDYRFDIAIPGSSMTTRSNPIRIHAVRPEQQLFWGDLHSGQTLIGCGAGTLADHYTFARDVAALQFVTHQANDHYMTRADWLHTRQQALTFDAPSRFVVFLGCEWSPYTPAGGDRNVIYRTDEPRLRRSGRFFTETDPDPEPDLPTAAEFHAAFKDESIMVNMHVGGRPTNLAYHAPALEPLAEIHSTHGTSEWFIEDALSRGYHIGITAGADGVAGRPGADHPGWRLNRNVCSGLTAVYATALTKDALWDAFQARCCYATNGARIRLEFEADGHPMGSAYSTNAHPLFNLSVTGTAAIERVDLLRGITVIHSWQIAAPNPKLLRILWSGASAEGTARAQRLIWDGTVKLTKGQVEAVWPIGFQSADDDVEIIDPTTVSWRSSTAGNHAGLLLHLTADATTYGHFATAPCSFDFAPDQVRQMPMSVDAGAVKRQVIIGPAPATDGPQAVDLTYRDTDPQAGEMPYWVRVVQVDQGRAWSTPIYITQG